MKSLDMFRLNGKNAIITGGAGHLGTIMSEALAEAGANVVIASRNLDKCKEVASRISKSNPGIEIIAFKLDISDRKSIKRCFSEVKERFDRIDILINNAYYGASNTLEKMSDKEWHLGVDGGVSGAFRCTSEIIPFMKEQGGGVIVNVSSMYGIVSPDWRIYRGTKFANPPNYGVAKAGLIQFTKYCACHLAQHGIRVNAISPGPFPSPDVQKEGWFMKELAAKNPMGRIGRPWELKGAVLFLCSDASTYVIGHNLVVDGGWTTW